jgi:VanZ family protein
VQEVVSSNLTSPTIFDCRFRRATRNRARAMAANLPREPHTVSKLQILWALAIAGLIIAASSRSTIAGPEIVNIDKVAHFGVYGLLATLVCRVGRGWRAAVWALVAASLFGLTDEWHQSWVPGRTSSVADWIADTFGAALAVGLYVGWEWYRRLLEMPLWPRRARVEET